MQSTLVFVATTWAVFDRCVGINTESIRLATEYQVKRARDLVESNYLTIINSGENYVGCDVYDMCSSDPPILFDGDSNDVVTPWYTSETPWHFPQCNDSAVLIGVRPNNHNEQTGELLTINSCPEYNSYSGCNYDNSPIKTSIKIPYDLDTNSQDFLDATCFTHELEDIWTTRVYSNCNTDEECIELYLNDNNINNISDISDNTIDSQNLTCLSYGICSNTPNVEIGSFESDYVEYQYWGDQRTGVLTQIPAMYWDALDTGSCPGTYDPRFRPWYAATASGPKDMILILDTSGSMGATTDGSTRLEVMKEAATTVLDTLTSDDYATVIDFSGSATSYSNTLLSVTDENRCELDNYINDLTAIGGTNYESAFELAYEIMSNSMSNGDISGCSAQVILFLTDGAITSGDDNIVGLIETLKSDVSNEGIEFKILTYAIGNNLDSDDLSLLRAISCNNDGIYYEIENIDDDLRTTMASYYQIFVSLRDTSNTADDIDNVIWIDFVDRLTEYRLISANLPVYDKTSDPYTLLGVVVTDVAAERIIDSTKSQWGNDVGIYDDFDTVFNDMLSSSKQCPSLSFDYDQLESIRKSIANSASCESSSSGSSDNDDQLGTEVIVIGALSIFVVVLLVVVCACYVVRSRLINSKQNQSKGEENNEKQWNDNVYKGENDNVYEGGNNNVYKGETYEYR